MFDEMPKWNLEPKEWILWISVRVWDERLAGACEFAGERGERSWEIIVVKSLLYFCCFLPFAWLFPWNLVYLLCFDVEREDAMVQYCRKLMNFTGGEEADAAIMLYSFFLFFFPETLEASLKQSKLYKHWAKAHAELYKSAPKHWGSMKSSSCKMPLA